MSVAAILLAAGLGRRFGAEPKLLARFEGRPLVALAASAALKSQASPVLTVTGHGADGIEAVLAGMAIRIVRNPAYADGLSTSLKAGFAALPAEAEAAVVLLGDMPLVGPALIDRLIDRWRETRPAAVVPVTATRRGNPVVLSRALMPEIMALTGDAGAGALLRARSDVVEEPVEDASALLDIDTPDGLAALARS